MPSSRVAFARGLAPLVLLTFLHVHAAADVARERDASATAETLAWLSTLDDAAGRKVWVYLTDKAVFDDVAYQARLDRVAAALDEHAAARRAKTLGPALVDDHDIPVHEGYVSQLAGLGATVVHESRWLNAVSIRAPLSTLRAIAALPFVQRLTPVRGGRSIGPEPSQQAGPRSAAAAGDPFDYGASRDQLDEINVLAAHALGLSGAGVRIAMLDTGFKRDHPAFDRVLQEGRLIAQWDFINGDGETQDEPGDPEGQHAHGTATWSVVGGFDEGELIGAAHGADYLLAKTEDTSQEVPAEEDSWVAAAEWADGLGADIISSSLAYIAWYEYPDMDGDTAVTTIGADIAASRGIVVCNSAGNWGTQDWFYIGAPADADSCIAVGATEPDGSMWLDSSHGPTADGRTKPEVCARGASVYSAQIPGGHGGPGLYRWADGTSMSCPLVAGAAALVLEAHPGWTAMMVREALMMSADNAGAPDNHRGWGRIDATGAIGPAAGVTVQQQPAAAAAAAAAVPRLVASPNPFASAVAMWLDLPAGRTGPAELAIYSSLGRRVRTLELGAGAGPVRWDGRNAHGQPLPSGAYFVRLEAGDVQVIRKLIRSR